MPTAPYRANYAFSYWACCLIDYWASGRIRRRCGARIWHQSDFSLLLVFYPWTSAYAAVDWIKLTMLALLFFTVPLLAKSRSAADRYMGDLSYPVYLLHLPVIYVIAANWPPEWPSAVQAVFLFAGVLVLSAALMNFVDRPVDRLRQRWAARAMPLGG
jgi:peptidoglycan/LPS O-acetylase OafA/YrhL